MNEQVKVVAEDYEFKVAEETGYLKTRSLRLEVHTESWKAAEAICDVAVSDPEIYEPILYAVLDQ
jgi:hypothetical protein